MLTTLLSLLGSTGLRLLWGELASWVTKMQEHSQEMDRLKLQSQLQAQTHAESMETQKLAHTLGVQMVQVQAEVAQDKQEGETFDKASVQLGNLTGIKFIDIWKSCIVPALATLCIFIVFMHSYNTGFAFDDYTKELCGSVIGLFIADRFLFRRGK